jgi:hypothetical protein
MTTMKRGIAIGAAGLVAAGATGVAIAATSSDEGKKAEQAIIDDAAGKLNVAPSQLRDALKGAVQDQIDQAVKDGKLTKAQGDAIKKRMDDTGRVLPFGGPGGPGGFRHGGPGEHGERGFFGGPGSLLSAAADYLGLKESELRSELASGKSLAKIADEKNKSKDGLKSALHDAVKKDLDAAVKANKITQAQEDERLKDIDSHLDDIISGSFQRGERGRKFGPRRGGAPDGAAPRGGAYPGPPPAAGVWG